MLCVCLQIINARKDGGEVEWERQRDIMPHCSTRSSAYTRCPGLWALTLTRLELVCEEAAPDSFYLSLDTVQRQKPGWRRQPGISNCSPPSPTAPCATWGPSWQPQSRQKRSIFRCRLCSPGSVWKVWEQISSLVDSQISKMRDSSPTSLSLQAAQRTPGQPRGPAALTLPSPTGKAGCCLCGHSSKQILWGMHKRKRHYQWR